MFFHVPGAALAPALLASSHSDWEDLPSLWRILIALGDPGDSMPPLAGQAAPPSETMQAPARQALSRLAAFNAFLLHHPLLHRIAQLPIFLDSVLDFLTEQLAAFAPQESQGVVLIVQIGSTSWPENLPEYAQELRDMWQRIESMAAARQYHALDEVLGFTDSGESFGQWRAWANGYGLETLNAPYFRALEYGGYWTAYHAPPPARPYKQKPPPMLPHDKPAGSVPDWMGKLLIRGMRLLRMLPAASDYKGTGYLLETSVAYKRANELAVEGEDSDDDDNVLPDPDDLPGPSLFEQWRYTGFHPYTEDGKVGLRCLTEADGEFFLGDVALAAEWDEIILPRDAMAWAKRDGKYCLIALAAPCTVTLADCCDHIRPYHYDQASCVVGKNGKFGVVHCYEARMSVPAEYDQIKLHRINFVLSFHVRKDRLWGVLDDAGAQLQPLIFERIEQDDRDDYKINERGFHVVRGARSGWITCEGSLVVPCAWDEVRPCEAAGLFAVRTGELWGLVTGGGQQWLACAYLHVTPVAMAAHLGQVAPYEFELLDDSTWPEERDVHDYIAHCDPARANVLIAVGMAGGVGLVDQANRPLVPCKYLKVEMAKSGGFQDPRWLIVASHAGLFGVLDVATGEELVPCAAEWLGMVVAPNMERPIGWTANGDVHRLHYLDGTAVFDAAFRWIDGDYHTPFQRERDAFTEVATGKLSEEWHKGKHVRAMLVGEALDEERIVLLGPGQPIQTEHEALAEAFLHRGDRQAALTLADIYFYGDGVSKDLTLARQWYGRACGNEAAPAPQMVAAESNSDGDLLDTAARRFAGMVFDGAGGLQDTALARRWAEVAASVDKFSCKSDTALLLARILLDDGASDADAARACALLEKIDAPSRDEGAACMYRAVCLRDGRGVEKDWDLALTLFIRADACGIYHAAEAIADLLRNMANGDVTFATTLLLIREANYYERKFQESTPDEIIG